MELRREHAELAEERDGIVAMLADDRAQWKLVGAGLRQVKAALGELNVRRTQFADAPEIDTEAALEAMIVREPITVILSERGWIRAAKGRIEDPSELKFKEGDRLQFLVPAETTDKLLIFASDGRFFTLGCDKLPGARGHGEPLRLMIDLDDKVGLVDVFVHRPGGKRVLASKDGYGFILPEAEAIAVPPRRQAGAERPGPGEPAAGRGRPSGCDRRQRQAAGLPGGRTAGDAARQGREAAVLSRGRPARRHGFCRGRRRVLDHLGRAHARLAGMARLAGTPGERRQAGAQGLPGHQALQAELGMPILSSRVGGRWPRRAVEGA
jgi:hypothetical protein